MKILFHHNGYVSQEMHGLFGCSTIRASFCISLHCVVDVTSGQQAALRETLCCDVSAGLLMQSLFGHSILPKRAQCAVVIGKGHECDSNAVPARKLSTDHRLGLIISSGRVASATNRFCIMLHRHSVRLYLRCRISIGLHRSYIPCALDRATTVSPVTNGTQVERAKGYAVFPQPAPLAKATMIAPPPTTSSRETSNTIKMFTLSKL